MQCINLSLLLLSEEIERGDKLHFQNLQKRNEKKDIHPHARNMNIKDTQLLTDTIQYTRLDFVCVIYPYAHFLTTLDFTKGPGFLNLHSVPNKAIKYGPSGNQ
jgi:hypothetical protein